MLHPSRVSVTGLSDGVYHLLDLCLSVDRNRIPVLFNDPAGFFLGLLRMQKKDPGLPACETCDWSGNGVGYIGGSGIFRNLFPAPNRRFHRMTPEERGIADVADLMALSARTAPKGAAFLRFS
jgi:hypothetical protein